MADPDDIVLTLDIDCGPLAPGHRLRLTGLSDRGISRDDLTSREQEVACRMVALEYALTPGVRPDEVVDGFDESFVLQATYRADVDLPWTTAGYGGFGPGEIDLFAGGGHTRGALGPWPVPEGARKLTFALYRPPPHRGAIATLAGTVVIDLGARIAEWQPAGE
jgi:hypothetical protein